MATKVLWILISTALLAVNVNGVFCFGEAPQGMVLIKGGTFRMGTDKGEPHGEEPIHAVTLSSFYMGKFEVTQKEWKAVMGNNPSLFKGDDRPVQVVDWYDAIKYCNKRSEMEGLTPCYTGEGDDITCNFEADGFRLPTEAEWEYAARGGLKSRGFQFSGSNNPDEVAWYEKNSGFKPQPVGQKKPNELGIYDMSGNTWEWCWEWYDNDYYKNSPPVDPRGATSGKNRSYRGGGCCGRKHFMRSTARYNQGASFKRFDMGFRVVKNTAGKQPGNMALVEGGTFNMGSTDGVNDQRPAHPVTLNSFYMAAVEVTQEEWTAVMGYNPSVILGAKCPVDGISWNDAVKYCNKKSRMEGLTPCYKINGDTVTCDFGANGYRLPTEAEWEYACRGGSNSKNFIFSGSNNVDEVGWYVKNSGYLSQPVGSKNPNEAGVYDMSGSVWEWCWDWYDKDYYKKSPVNNPNGPLSGIRRVARGGAIYSPGDFLQSTYRRAFRPFRALTTMGFRLVKTTVK